MSYSPDHFSRQYSIDAALCQKLLSEALHSGGDYCDLYFQQSTHTAMLLEDGAVNQASHASDLGVGIRVVKGDAVGYAYSEDLSMDRMLQTARLAAAIASSERSATAQPIVPLAPAQYYPVTQPWQSLSIAQYLPWLYRVEAKAIAVDPRICKVRVRFAQSEAHMLVVDSLGHWAYDYQPSTVMVAVCVAEQNGRREENSYSLAARRGAEQYDDATLDRIAEEAASRTVALFGAIPAPAGQLPVVLAAGGAGILLHEAIGHGMEADFNRKNVSIYSDKINQPIAEPFVSIVDDATIESARGSINVDDEGTLGQRTVLVENGVLCTYLHDRISAKHYGVASTGSGRRQSFRHIPLPRMRNTYMLPGPHKPEEIIKSVERGIYAQTFSNGQVKIGAGDFTFYVKMGYLIENGKLTQPIKDINLIGNGPEVLRTTTMVADDMTIDPGGWTCGKDGQSVPVSIGMPTVKVAAMTVGGTQHG